MKTKIKYLFLLAISCCSLIGCRDESKVVYDTAKLPQGSYARMLSTPPDETTTASFNTTDFPFQAEIQGASASEITSLEIKVRLLNSTGGVIKDFVALGSITTWAVVPSTTELPRGSVSFKGSDIGTALSLAPADLAAANVVAFATTLKLKDGRGYDASNYDPGLNNDFYKAAYEFFTTLK